MSEWVFFLEEASARAMLEGLLPRIAPQCVDVRYIVFDGKQDMEKQLVRRMRDYRNRGARFFVIRDQDSGDCLAIKERLQQFCADAGRPNTIVRIVCRELESFYLADLAAVEYGLGIAGIAKRQKNQKFRTPDRLGSPSQELIALTKGRYQKIGGSRAIAPHLDINNTRSHSFKMLVEAIQSMAFEEQSITSN
ncbi:MAG TPA: hypothetical protein DEP36_07660 [Gammaproteobacteria bacterium]|nr:DUF4276 family protein [Candidatus Competibacteraceae bacterium]MCP5135019.1 DUF4276 family protein [Gammaproteobacteria bacterium]HCB13426.1 hypothetical protein [Gammaproteobacteria bacterium]HRY18568.1 DUF4276 family protein [Candidatus Competibacteraceae bacterium]